MTKVVNLTKEKCDIKITRTKDNKIPPPPEFGCFGNPYFLKNKDDEVERAKVVAQHKEYFLNRVEVDLEFRKAVLDLRGKTLGCFCKQPDREVACHGDNIVEWLETHNE